MPNIFGGNYEKLYNMFEFVTDESVLIDFDNFHFIFKYIPIAMYLVDIGLIFIALYLVFGNSKTSFIAILVFGAGVCSKVLMGFMPTVFASGNRTQLILLVMMIILIAMMIDKQSKKTKENLLNIFMKF